MHNHRSSTDLQTETAIQAAAPSIQSVTTRGGIRAQQTKLTAGVLAAMRPGDVVRCSQTRGFYAECGARGVALKVATDLARGKTARKTLGKWPAKDLAQARLEAVLWVAKASAGVDPRGPLPPAAAPAAGGQTVRAAAEAYLADMTKRGCAPKTVTFTRGRLLTHLPELLDLPIAAVKPSECQAAHDRISVSSGPVSANKALRDLRAVWNFACRKSDDPESFPRRNPASSVTMNVERPRRAAVILDLPGWWRRTGDLPNPLRTCMHRLALLTGLRMANVAGCRREWIDLAPSAECIRFPAEVMKARQAFTCPLSPAAVALVRRAVQLGDDMAGVVRHGRSCPWLFPTRSADGRAWVATSAWRERTLGSHECGHALRHSYNTLALSTPGVTAHDVERLLAHAVAGVAGHYYHPDAPATLAHLRAAQELISARILAACGAE